MFPTFISILDIQSWWEVPSIAHFCSLFRTAFNLLDFDIEDLEEALLTDGTEESSWLQELIVHLLSGCLPNNEISTFNYQMFLRRLFRQKCQEHDRYNPFNTDCDFTLLPLRTKVDILYALCDFRLDAEDVSDQLKNLEADSLRVEPLGYDRNDSAYWYFYGTRLYREDFQKTNNKKKSIWQVICFTEEDWFQLTKKFKNSTSKPERALYHTLNKNFLPELPRLFKEKERQARRRLLENQPRRTSDRIRKLDIETPEVAITDNNLSLQESSKKREHSNCKKEVSESVDSITEDLEGRQEMAAKRKEKGRQRKASTDSSDYCKDLISTKRKKVKSSENEQSRKSSKPAPVGRQTNNSLSAADGQIVIQPAAGSAPLKKKLKTSQVFQQTDEDLQVGMHKILDFVKNHEDAWPFVDPVEEEYAPNYYSIIRRPMDLTRMEDRLDQGSYKTFDKFRSDFQLIVNNCRLYNGVENEYTEMVDNLLKVFEKATEKYLDQISSSDEEIAVENLNAELANKEGKLTRCSKNKKSTEPPPHQSSSRGRKPVLVAQSKKRPRSHSEASDGFTSEEVVEEKPKKIKKETKRNKLSKKGNKETREAQSGPLNRKTSEKSKNKSDDETKDKKKTEKELKKSKVTEKRAAESDVDADEMESKKKQSKKSERHKKHSKVASEARCESMKEIGEDQKKSKKHVKGSKLKKDKIEFEKNKDGKSKKRGRKKKKSGVKRSDSKSVSSKSPSPSPVRSVLSTPPPSSPESVDHVTVPELPIKETVDCPVKKNNLWENDFVSEEPPPFSPEETKPVEEELATHPPLPFAFKPAKDKHNKLRETIEKLKAKSEICRLQTPVFDFESDDHLKENKDKNKKIEDAPTAKQKSKDKIKLKKPNEEVEDSNNSQSECAKKAAKKKLAELLPAAAAAATVLPKQSNFDALSLATEQTLKDINKWLDDTPKFADFSSASNSPSYLALDEFDLLGTSKPEVKKVEKAVPGTAAPPVVSTAKKENPGAPSNKELKKKPYRDPSKFFNKRREIQRTIDRLQPGKGKGNLISSVQNASKPEEIFPLGPLSKAKDAKNSLIVKTDTNAPKLSLGSVLDSFGKHKFVDDPKKEEEEQDGKVDAPKEVEEPKIEPRLDEPKVENASPDTAVKEEIKDVKEVKVGEEVGVGGPTPNLSAWFKAFGAPKAPQKKSENKPEAKEEENGSGGGGSKSERVPLPDPSPSLDSPQPVARQRRISTGSSMSERSSFSQDLDSPRVGMDERGAYPAPYPSPLHRSPSGASPVTAAASPRPDISPRSAYPFNGQMRVGFYQDTVSNKSSPDKSCSPRENSQYYPPADHVYAPNTTQNNVYSYANTPYYTHPPNYSSTNPTPPYNMDGSSSSYYDTTKLVATEHYQAKLSQNYTANSPASSLPSPAPQPQHSPHSLHSQQSSVHSPSVHSPSLHSPQLQSPNPALHSPSLSVHSPQMNTSPQMSVMSPQMNSTPPQINAASPQMNTAMSPQMSVMSPKMGVVSPKMNIVTQQGQSPESHSKVNSPLNALGGEQFRSQQEEASLSGTKSVSNVNPNPSVFPVKKRAFVDSDLSQYATLQDEMVNRNLQMAHQLSMNAKSETEQSQQQQQQQILQQQQMHQVQEQLLQQVQLQQHQQQNQRLQQSQFHQQKTQQSLQQQISMDVYGKNSEGSLRTPSPPLQTQNTSQQRALQQLQKTVSLETDNSAVSAASSLRNMNVIPVSSQSNLYPSNYTGREAFSLNIPSSRLMMSQQQQQQQQHLQQQQQQQQQKLDLNKFTNMGYTGPEVNFSRALQQQYGRPELSYTRTTVQSTVSQASQLLSSQALGSTQTSAGGMLPVYQKPTTTQQQTHGGGGGGGGSYQSNRSVDSVAERLAAQVNQGTASSYKQEMAASRNNYNTTNLDMDQALGLSRNISNLPNFVDRYSNEQRMMAAGLQSSANPYYSEKGLGSSHMFNKPMSTAASQIFSQANMAAMNSYNQSMQQTSAAAAAAAAAASRYNRQMADLQTQPIAQPDIKSTAQLVSQDRKSRKKKTGSRNGTSSESVQNNSSVTASGSSQGFQSYAGLKGTAAASPAAAATSLDPAAISLKTSSVVPGSAFNFGPAASGTLGLYGDKDSYSNFLDEIRSAPNFYMAAAAAHHRPETGSGNKNAQPTSAPQTYPSFLNPAHQTRTPTYPPLGGPFIPPTAQAQLMDTSSQIYQHYLQAGVLNQGLLGAPGAYPPGYHPALAMRQPYDSMSRPSWL